MDSNTDRPKSPPRRFQQGPLTTALNLGPLAFLAGSWRGPGFNAIWRPDNPASAPLTTPANPTKRFLELNLTNDGFDFQVIPGVVPNRGLGPQTDLSLYGLHYLQRVSDADPAPSAKVCPHGYSTTAGEALHIEPGLFMNVPAAIPGTTPPVNAPTIVRMGSIPHGVTVLMQGPCPEMKPRPGQAEHPAPDTVQHPGQCIPGAQSHPVPRALPRHEPAASAPAGDPEPAGRRDPAGRTRRLPPVPLPSRPAASM